MKTVLVTGIAGFIGAPTAELLLREGWRVVGVDNFNDYYAPALKEHRLARLREFGELEVHRLDIEDAEALGEVFEKHAFNAVVNLAARAGVRYSMENPHVYFRTNAMGTLNILEEMRRREIRKLVLASTSSLYAGQRMPFSETLPVNTPISPYAAAKKAAEAIAYTYHHLYGLDVSVLRYFTVYGPAGRPDMCPFRFVKWIEGGEPLNIFGDGSQSRDFTFVDDIARGTVAALKPLGYEIINLGGGQNPVSLNQFIEEIEQILGRKAVRRERPAVKADMKETWADIGKAGRLLAWKPEISLREGLKRTVEWYLQNRGWAAEIAV